MSVGSITSIAAYIGHIQDTLGNSGGQLTINTSYKGSYTSISGVAGNKRSTDSISLSIQAIQSLANQQKQLSVKGSSAAVSGAVSDAVASAKDFLSDPKTTFTNLVNSLGGPEAFSQGIYSKSDQDAFIKAFQDGTLNVQSAVDVKGLEYDEKATLTGTSETASLTFNHSWYDSQGTSTQSGGLTELTGIGGLFYTFPRGSASS